MGDAERVTVFPLDHTYVFKRYFGPNAVFEALADHYDRDAYRFEVHASEWPAVEATLREFGYEPEVVEDLAAYVVVVEQYDPHAEILKRSVADWTRRGHRFFLMKDALAAERAVVEHGATPAAETDLAIGL